MTQPLVSVICICFNHEAFVKKAILSVLNQTYKNIELIVVNNGSTDDSEIIIKGLLKDYKQIKYIYLPKTLPLTPTFNLAFKEANGAYLIDLSADDKLLPQCVEKQVNFFLKQDEDTAIIFGNAYHINENDIRIKPYFKVNDFGEVTDLTLFNTNYIKLLSTGLNMCSVASIITTKHFKLLNGYNENLFFEDLDYWLRSARTYNIKFLDEFLVEKRFLQKSLGNQFYKKDAYSKKITQSMMRIYLESLNRNKSKDEHKALLKRIHFSMVQSFKNKKFFDLLKFGLIELKCRFYMFK